MVVARAKLAASVQPLYQAVRALTSVATVTAERELLARRLDEIEAAEGQTLHWWRLKDNYDLSSLKPERRLRLTTKDKRARDIVDELAEGPRCGHRQWLEPAFLQDAALSLVPAAQPILVPTSNIVMIDGPAGHHRHGLRAGAGRWLHWSPSDPVHDDFDDADTFSGLLSMAPRVDELAGYVQPNGLVVYEVRAGGQVAAAAIKRGEPFIQVAHLTLYLAERNYIDCAQ